jgi:hypothetical protein
MGTIVFAIAVAALAFGSGVVGLMLRVRLPERHAPETAREMIGSVTGLLGLLLAIVLGTLVGSSYTLYATQRSELDTLCARVLQLEGALEAYGPETKPGRDVLLAGLKEDYEKVWGGGVLQPSDLTVRSAFVGTKQLDQITSLEPKTDAQKQFLATASAAAAQIQQTELLMALQLAAGVSWPMVAVVVCWALLLFCGYGMNSRVNGTVISTLAIGAVAVASAIFLIIELSQPYSGAFRIPPAGVLQTIEALGS